MRRCWAHSIRCDTADPTMPVPWRLAQSPSRPPSDAPPANPSLGPSRSIGAYAAHSIGHVIADLAVCIVSLSAVPILPVSLPRARPARPGLLCALLLGAPTIPRFRPSTRWRESHAMRLIRSAVSRRIPLSTFFPSLPPSFSRNPPCRAAPRTHLVGTSRHSARKRPSPDRGHACSAGVRRGRAGVNATWPPSLVNEARWRKTLIAPARASEKSRISTGIPCSDP